MSLLSRSLPYRFAAIAGVISGLFIRGISYAAVYTGPGLTTDPARGIVGPVHRPIRDVVIDAVKYVLNFMALIAVIAIIVAGIWLVVGGGSDESKEKAKRIIIWTIVGLVIILFARVIVALVTEAIR